MMKNMPDKVMQNDVGDRRILGRGQGLHAKEDTRPVQVGESTGGDGAERFADPFLEGLQGVVPATGKDIRIQVGMDRGTVNTENDLFAYLSEDEPRLVHDHRFACGQHCVKEKGTAHDNVVRERRAVALRRKVCPTRATLFKDGYPGRDVL